MKLKKKKPDIFLNDLSKVKENSNWNSCLLHYTCTRSKTDKRD